MSSAMRGTSSSTRPPSRASRAIIALGLSILVVAGGSPAGAKATPTNPFTLVVTDAEVLAAAPAGDTVRWGLGVYPTAPDPSAFAQVFWNGALDSDGIAGTIGAVGLGDLVRDAVVRSEIEPLASPEAQAFAAVMAGAGSAEPLVEIIVTADPWPVLRERLRVLVIGVSPTLPVLIATRGTDPPGDGLLDPLGPGHPGVVSPFDLTAVVATVIGLDLPAGYPGQQLATVVDADAREQVAALASRFARDRTWPFPVAVAMILALLAAAILAGIAIRLVVTAGPHAARLGQRLAAVAAIVLVVVPIGYVVALLLPAASSAVRVAPILVAVAVGAWLAFRAERRTASVALGRLGLGLATAILGLTVVSAVRAGREPALSFWDSPLVSFRVSGLRNALAAFVIGGVLVAFGTTRLSRRRAGMFLVAGAGIIGYPSLGANLIAVLAFATGLWVALEVDGVGRLRLRGAGAAALIGIVATGVALASDAGGATHSGRLVDATEARGTGLLVEIIRSRLETNLGRVGEVGPIAWVGLVLLVPLILLIWHDAVRGHERAGTMRLVSRLSPRVRAGAAGIMTAALISLVLEDTGFLTAGTIAPFAVALVAAATAATLPSPDGDQRTGRAVQR